MIGIYKIINLINGKVYVGQSNNIKDRWYQHQYKAFHSTELAYHSPIHQAFRKYGLDNFQFEIIEECELEALDDRERYWIKQLNSLIPNGYNILIGGQQYRKEVVKYCTQCGAPLSSANSATQLCLTCYHQDLRKTHPDKDTLYNQLVMNNGNFRAVARIYGVTDNAIRKWCKRYKIPFHSSDYKR